jgi:hypothetical protein
MNDLIFVPFPLDEESPTSMLRRFALRHGCEIPQQLCSITIPINFHASTLSSESPLAQWIAQRADKYGSRFLEGFYKPMGVLKENMPFEIYGTRVPGRLVRFTGTAYCSECWREGREHIIKDLKPSLNCPYHNRRYLFECPNCKKHLWWIDLLLGQCSCKHFLVSDTCSREDTKPECFILKCLREKDHATLETLKKTLTQLQYKMGARPDDLQNRQILEAAICLISGDEAGVEQYLTRLHASHPQLPATVISAKLSLVKHPLARKVMARYNEITKWPLPIPMLEGPPPLFTLKRIQVRQAAAIRACVLKKLAEEHGILWPKLTRKADLKPAQFLPLLEQAWAWKLHARNYLIYAAANTDLESACEAVHVKLFTFKKLVRAGMFHPISKPNQIKLIPNSELADFLKKYESVDSLAERLGLSSHATRVLLSRHHVLPFDILKSRTPTIFAREDTDRILAHHTHIKPYAQKRTRIDHLEFVQKKDLTYFSSCSVVAEQLRLQTSTVREYAKAGVFSIKRCNKSILIPNTEIDTFHERYISAEEYAGLLGVSRCMATQTLIEFGLCPIAEWRFNRCHSPLFLRKEVEERITGHKAEEKTTLPIREARCTLGLSDITVRHLIKIGDLAVDNDAKPILFASTEKVKNFYTTHANSVTVSQLCNIPMRTLQSSLKKIGIIPVCGPVINGCPETLYRLADLIGHDVKVPNHTDRPAFSKVTRNQEIIAAQFCELIPLTTILKKYSISKLGITKVFVNTGFMAPISIGTEKYLSAYDAKKVSKILDQNYTPSMIDKMLNTRGYARALCKQGKLRQARNLPKELSGQILITRRSMKEFLGSLPRRVTCEASQR